jgi:hypothetical protein
MWIGMDVSGSFQDQYDVICGLEQMIQNDALTLIEGHCNWNRCGKMLS